MPFAGNRTYSLTPAYAASPNTTILSGNQHNVPLADIEAALSGMNTEVRPASVGGTGMGTFAAKKLLYSSTANAWGTTDVSDFALTLLDDTTQVAMRGTLGAAPSGYGLGEYPVTRVLSTADSGNTITGTGWALVGTANMATVFGSSVPGSGTGGVLQHEDYTADTAVQTFRTVVNPFRSFSRIKGNNVWGAWREVYNQASAVGTVSSASGVPTGALFETGTNANGTYERYVTGVQRCFHFATATYVDASTLSYSWTFPAAFAAAPDARLTMHTRNRSNATITGQIGGTKFTKTKEVPSTKTGTLHNFSLLSPDGLFVTGDTCAIALEAVGFW